MIIAQQVCQQSRRSHLHGQRRPRRRLRRRRDLDLFGHVYIYAILAIYMPVLAYFLLLFLIDLGALPRTPTWSNRSSRPSTTTTTTADATTGTACTSPAVSHCATWLPTSIVYKLLAHAKSHLPCTEGQAAVGLNAVKANTDGMEEYRQMREVNRL